MGQGRGGSMIWDFTDHRPQSVREFLIGTMWFPKRAVPSCEIKSGKSFETAGVSLTVRDLDQ